MAGMRRPLICMVTASVYPWCRRLPLWFHLFSREGIGPCFDAVVLLFPLSVVAALLAVDAIEVRSLTDCPSSDAIAAKLRPLLPDGPAQESRGDIAWVDPVAQVGGGAAEVRLRLVRSDATLVVDRRLVVEGSCDDIADTLATVLAAWRTWPAAQVAPSRASLQETAPADHGGMVAGRMELTASKGLRLAIGVSAGSAFVGGLTATGSLELLAGRATSHWQVRLAGMMQASRQRSLDPGQINWRHTGAFVGLGWRSLGPRWSFAADAGPVLGWATVAGQGFTPSRGQRAFEYGAGGAIRVRRNIGAWTIWVEGQTTGWVENQQAVLQGSSNHVDLPGFDMIVSLGASMEVIR